MNYLRDQCIFTILTKELLEKSNRFSCDHNDLDEFFNQESYLYSDQLLGKSYCFLLKEDPKVIVCAFTLSNSSIKLDYLPSGRKSKIKKNIPHPKHSNNYPAVLIGRLGISKDYKGLKIGDQLMDFIKAWFIDPHNKTGCRFLIVDSYNEDKPKKYYERNGFDYIFSTEEQEKDYTNHNQEEELKTRLMFFDLIRLLPAK